MTKARAAFKKTSCLYVQTDHYGHILRVGKAGKGLEPRYRGGNGYALDAAMDSSGNLVLVAPVKSESLAEIERYLIYHLRPPFNNQGKLQCPKSSFVVKHIGHVPGGLKEVKLLF